MSKTVVSGITCTYGSITGNVSSVSTNTTSVSDQSDLNSLENRLNIKIRSLEAQICELKARNEEMEIALNRTMSEYRLLSDSLVAKIRETIAFGNKELNDILNNEMK